MGDASTSTLPAAARRCGRRASRPTSCSGPTIPRPKDEPLTRFIPKPATSRDLLVGRERLASLDLSRPLRNAIDFTAPAATQRLVDERLARFRAARYALWA